MAASFSLSAITSSSVTVTITPDSSIPYYRIFCRRAADENDTSYNESGIYITSTFTRVIAGLSPETNYLVNIGTSRTGTQPWTWIGAQSFTTKSASDDFDEVEDWNWMASNGLATAAQTQQAYAAITGNGNLSEFSYLVWNDIVNKTYEVITDRGGTWNTAYGTLADTLMTPTDKHMTAQRFNAVIWNLAQYKTPLNGLTRKAQGDPMLGSYFIDLTDSINNTIYRG